MWVTRFDWDFLFDRAHVIDGLSSGSRQPWASSAMVVAPHQANTPPRKARWASPLWADWAVAVAPAETKLVTVQMLRAPLIDRNQPGSHSRNAVIGIAVQSANVARLATPWPTSDTVASGSTNGCGQRGALAGTRPATMVANPAARARRRTLPFGAGITELDKPSTRNPGTITLAERSPRAANPLM